MCNLHHGKAAVFVGATLLLNATAAAMCFFAAAVCSSVGAANLFASLFFIVRESAYYRVHRLSSGDCMQYNIIFGGLLLTASDGLVSIALQSSFFFHAYEILMVNGTLPIVPFAMT